QACGAAGPWHQDCAAPAPAVPALVHFGGGGPPSAGPALTNPVKGYLARDLLPNFRWVRVNSPEIKDHLGMLAACVPPTSRGSWQIDVVPVEPNQCRAALPRGRANSGYAALAASVDRPAPGNLHAGPGRQCLARARSRPR